jgi:hypothetical protein
MTTELIREIAGHVLAVGIVGWAAYLSSTGQAVPDWLVGAIGIVVGAYFPGVASAIRARFR